MFYTTLLAERWRVIHKTDSNCHLPTRVKFPIRGPSFWISTVAAKHAKQLPQIAYWNLTVISKQQPILQLYLPQGKNDTIGGGICPPAVLTPLNVLVERQRLVECQPYCLYEISSQWNLPFMHQYRTPYAVLPPTPPPTQELPSQTAPAIPPVPQFFTSLPRSCLVPLLCACEILSHV